jgi:hypothetical protein
MALVCMAHLFLLRERIYNEKDFPLLSGSHARGHRFLFSGSCAGYHQLSREESA